MAKAAYVIAYTLIVRNADGEHINGTGSRGDLDYAKRLAYPWLRINRSGTYASIDLYVYDPKISWQQLQPLVTVSLDDEREG